MLGIGGRVGVQVELVRVEHSCNNVGRVMSREDCSEIIIANTCGSSTGSTDIG